MAKTKKAVKAKRPRTTTKKVKPSKEDVQPTRPDGAIIKKMKVDIEERDNMLEALTESANEDVKLITKHWFEGDKAAQKKISDHYELNGSEYIVSIFRGNRTHALLVCPEADKDLIG